MKSLFAGMGLAAALPLGVFAVENVVYREDFDRFGNFTEVFNAGATVAEERNGVLCLDFASKTAGEFRQGCFRIDVPPCERTWKFGFNFAFPADGERVFTLRFHFGDRDRPDVRTLTVAEAGSHFGCDAVPPPKDGMPGFLQQGGHNWNKGAVVVTDGKAAFWTYRNGRLVRECETTFPKAPLFGWNFGFQRENGGRVRIDQVAVTDGTDRPYDRGDPTEWLAQATLKPEAIDAGWGAPVAAKQPLAVDFGREKAEIRFRAPFTPDKKGRTAPVQVVYGCETGTPVTLQFVPMDEKVFIRLREYGNGAFTNVTRCVNLQAEALRITGLGVMDREFFHSRPPLRDEVRYRQREINEIFAAFDRLPRPKDKVFALETVRLAEGRYRTFLNGEVVGELETEKRLVSVTVTGEGVEARACAVPAPADPDPQVYRLPLPKGGFALERVRENCFYGLENNGYLQRRAFDAMPSSCLFNVPKRAWVRAKAVCRVSPDAPKSAIPVITARLSHFYENGGRSLAMCEQTVDLRDKGAKVRKVGSDYEVTFDFDIGKLQDLVYMTDGLSRRPLTYLNFEFTGPCWEKARFYMDPAHAPAESETSSLVVLSGELEASPADMTAVANGLFSLYYPDETAGATVTVTPRVAGEYAVTAEVRDETGKAVEKKVEKVEGGEKVARAIEFEAKAFGRYEVDYVLTDRAGRELMRHAASFVRLRPNTRQAGLDTPYYSWNFRGAHGTPWKFDDWAVAFSRLGVPRTTLLGAFTGGTNKKIREDSPECVKWGFTQVQFPFIRDLWMTMDAVKSGKGPDPEKLAKAPGLRREMVEAFPHSRTALIFHESGTGPFPKELYGGITEVDDDVRDRDARVCAIATYSAEAWRKADPTVKLIHGNSSGTVGLVARLMRGGYRKDLFDAMGEESVGMSEPPEMSTALLPWMLKRLARHYGYPENMDCPREWKSRYFEWRYENDKTPAASAMVRDALIAHALGYTVIPVGAETETANSYANSIWCSGTFARWPLAYPRPAAAATAYLTQVLDRAKFVRMVPTGSLTVYALEFETPSGLVYALWTSRGETTATAEREALWFWPRALCGAPGLRQVSMTGREMGVVGAGPFRVGEDPCWLLADDRIASFRAKLSRTFPRERYPGMAAAVKAQPFASTNEFELAMRADRRIEQPFDNAPHRVGRFAAANVVDDEKGACIELKHISKPDCPELMEEYVTLKVRDPQPVAGTPSTLGVWVKGSSNWGRVYLEFEDAEGERWFTAGCGGVGEYTYDWPRKMSTNYDGWNFLQMPLLHGSPVKIAAPGDNEWQWTRDGRGNGRIDFPIKVTSVSVGQCGRTLNLLEMEAGPDSVRIGPVEVW